MNKDNKKHGHLSRRAALLVLSVVLILSVSVGGTLAYLIRETGPKTNTFIPGEVTTSTEEKFDEQVKKDVYVQNGKNDGSLPVYVRAKVIFNWVDKDGETVLSEPVIVTDDENSMVNINWVGENGDGNWVKEADGYYYYQQVLQPGGQTSNLIESCSPKNGVGPVDGQLQVTILTQTLQADVNKTAVATSWGASAVNYVPSFSADEPTT